MVGPRQRQGLQQLGVYPTAARLRAPILASTGDQVLCMSPTVVVAVRLRPHPWRASALGCSRRSMRPRCCLSSPATERSCCSPPPPKRHVSSVFHDLHSTAMISSSSLGRCIGAASVANANCVASKWSKTLVPIAHDILHTVQPSRRRCMLADDLYRHNRGRRSASASSRIVM